MKKYYYDGPASILNQKYNLNSIASIVKYKKNFYVTILELSLNYGHNFNNAYILNNYNKII
jgi:hypothetical protein